MWELNHKECWVLKNWCFWTVVLEKTLESPLDCKEMQPVHPKGNQSWIFIGRSDAEAEAPILCLPMWRTDSLEKTLMLGKIEVRRSRGTTEDESVGCHHRLNGYESEQTLGVGDGQGSLPCCSPWVAKSQARLSNWTELNWCVYVFIWGGGVVVRWAHVIMEAKKSQDLQKANSRLKKGRWCNSSPSPKTNLKVHRLGSKEEPVFQLDSECRKTWY